MQRFRIGYPIFLEKAIVKLDFGQRKAVIFYHEVKMFRVGSSHFCIKLYSERIENHLNDNEAKERI